MTSAVTTPAAATGSPRQRRSKGRRWEMIEASVFDWEKDVAGRVCERLGLTEAKLVRALVLAKGEELGILPDPAAVAATAVDPRKEVATAANS